MGLVLVVPQSIARLQAVVLLLGVARRPLMVQHTLAMRVRDRLVTQSRRSVGSAPVVLGCLLVSAHVVVAKFVLVILSGEKLELTCRFGARLVMASLFVGGLVCRGHQIGLEHGDLHH